MNAQTKGKGLDEFRAQFGPPDPRPKVIAALKSLGDAWETSQDFARRAGISSQKMPEIRELFPEHIVEVLNRARDRAYVWAGTKELAAKMRKSLASNG